MRAIVVGAVESTRIAISAIGRSPDWELAAVVTLPPSLASRHSDFVDLSADAAALGAAMIHAADCNAPDCVAAIAAVGVDLVFVIGWSQLCRAEFVAAAGGRLVGYHPAALPRLRGRAAIPWTILAAEPITAGSLFWIAEGVDSGPIIGQHYFHVAADEDAEGLYALHMAALARLLEAQLPLLAAGTAAAMVQDERFATWAARRTPADGVIDWRRSAADVARLVRAVTRPYPGATTIGASGDLTLWKARVGDDGWRHLALPGQVIARDADGFSVMCGDGMALQVTEWSGAVPRLHQRLGVPA